MMAKLRLKKEIEYKELEKYGFKMRTSICVFEESINYRMYFTPHNRNLQIESFAHCTLASKAQIAIYKMTVDGVLEIVDNELKGME